MAPRPPRDRRGFEIALICALPLEAKYVQAVFDKFWEKDGRRYGKVHGDQNEYTTGVIGEFNVVLAHMPGIGKVNAASAASSLRISFPEVRVAIVVGICGGAPLDRHGVEIVLGDVIISQEVVQYDFGRQFPNVFERKNTLDDAPGRLPLSFRSLLAKAQTPHGFEMMQEETAALLQSLEMSVLGLRYPGLDSDMLYEPTDIHKHRDQTQVDCVCAKDGDVCKDAHVQKCEELGCDRNKPVLRQRLQAAKQAAGDSATALLKLEPMIHTGIMGSADTVLKSGTHRDCLAENEKIIAFEMEGAGVWEHFPSIIIKGVCDYADSHKNKDWQQYAAAAAACCMKAFLKRATPQDEIDDDLFWHVPFDRLPKIIGRDEEVRKLKNKLFHTEDSRAAVYGLGGIGKSRIAWEMANYARSCQEPRSVFWIQASNIASFEKDFLEIGRKLNIPALDDSKDRNQLVKRYLENEFTGKFLFVLDSADDEAIWCPPIRNEPGDSSLLDCIPRTDKGALLVTTRSQRIATRLAARHIIRLESLKPVDAVEALQSLMPDEGDISDSGSQISMQLVEKLAYLPLAIVQAAAYINMNSVSVRNYLELLHETQTEKEIIELLGKDFEDESRYRDSQDPVASTWLVSFRQLQAHHKQAMEYLAFMSCLDEKNIPQFLLPELASKTERMESIGTLRGYSFIQVQSEGDFEASLYSMHRLVRLAMRNWLDSQDSQIAWNKTAIERVNYVLPTPEYENRELWTACFQHAQLLCTAACDEDFEAKYRLMRGVGLYLMDQGFFTQSVNCLLQVATWRKERFGDRHKTTLGAYFNVGTSLDGKGDYEQAEWYLVQSYRGLLDEFGPEHPDTLRSISNLALTCSRRGKLEQAEELEVKVLEIYQRVLGAEHPDTLASINNLASTYSDRGKLEQAEELQVKVLEIRQRVLGTEHHDTLASINNLAWTYFHRGKLEQAEELQVKVLEIHQRVLGAGHPDTLASISDLAWTYFHRGKLEQAEELQVKVLEIHQRVLGAGHPDTLASMNNLAFSRHTQGRGDEAAR